MGGIGGFISGLARAGMAQQTGQLEGENQANTIANSRAMAMNEFARQQALAEAQEQRLEGQDQYYRSLNPTKVQVAGIGADSKENVATTTTDGRVQVAGIGADSRVKVGAGHDATSAANNANTVSGRSADNAADNTTRIRVANINAASRQAAMRLRVGLAQRGASGQAMLKGLTMRGQALLSQYPDDASLEAAEAQDPSLTQALDTKDPQTSVSLRDAYHVAQQAQQNKVNQNIAGIVRSVPDAGVAGGLVKDMGLGPRTGNQAPPRPLAPGGTGAPAGGIPDVQPPWATPQGPPAPGPTGSAMPNPTGLSMTPAPNAPPPATPPPAPAGGPPKQKKTQADMAAFLAANPRATAEAYQGTYDVAPDPVQAGPYGSP